MIHGSLYDILSMTAWRMETPELFGGLHILMMCAMVISAAVAAALTTGRSRSSDSSDSMLTRVLAASGWILLALELYKQLFLFYIVNDGAYDWWYFPFQLCSVPIYLCISLPFIHGRLRGAVMTFLAGYTLVSALAALIYPQDFLRPYITLTMHGFIWHGILIYISLTVILSGAAYTRSGAAVMDAAILFVALSIIAVLINTAAEPAMQAAYAARRIPHDHAAMFYMNPYHLSPQPLVSSVQMAAGIPPGLMLYGLVIIAAGSAAAVIPQRIGLGGKKPSDD